MPIRLSLSFSALLFSILLFSNSSWCAPKTTETPTASLLPWPDNQYVKREKMPGKVGTTIYKKDKAFHGYNIYTSNDDSNVFVHLVDMDGTLVHSWVGNPHNGPIKWKQVTAFPDGSLFLTSELTTPGWQKVDAASHNIAIYDMPGYKAHHAGYCLKEGGFLSLVANIIPVPFQGLTLKIRNDSLVQVSSKGQPIKIIPLSKLFEKDPGYQKKLGIAYQRLKEHRVDPSQSKAEEPFFDPFHANNIANLEWDIPGVAKKGAWLATVRNLNRIILVDPQTEKIIWQWGEHIISLPHHATFLKGDRILLFDNGFGKKSSRAIIVDMRSKKIVWQYGQKSGQEFFSRIQGSAQRLPNGNTLIAESDKGRAFEVTGTGEIVWEWYADLYTQGEAKGKRRLIYQMQRLPYDFFKDVKFNHGKIEP